MRRAISWVYWEPKSRIRMRWAWMSWLMANRVPVTESVFREGKTGPQSPARSRSNARSVTAHRVVGCLFGDRDVMDVTLAHAGGGDPHKHGLGAHGLDVPAAGIT